MKFGAVRKLYISRRNNKRGWRFGFVTMSSTLAKPNFSKNSTNYGLDPTANLCLHHQIQEEDRISRKATRQGVFVNIITPEITMMILK